MSNEASTTKQKEATADEGNQKPVTPMVEALEEDDEFEEFASAAAWDEVKDGGVASVDDSAEWQENWDDDDIDDDFTKALRAELMANS